MDTHAEPSIFRGLHGNNPICIMNHDIPSTLQQGTFLVILLLNDNKEDIHAESNAFKHFSVA